MAYLCKSTKILTMSGFKPIECITYCDKLMNSDGIFRLAKSLGNTTKGHIIYKIITAFHRKPIQCTEDQRFLTRTASSIAIWKKAYELTTNDYVGMIKNIFDIIPSFTFDNHSMYVDKKEEWFLLGYFIVNGWLDTDNQEINFIIKDNQVLKELRKVLALHTEDCCCLNKLFDIPQEPYNTYTCYNSFWYKILKTFCKKDNSLLTIEIPEWVHNAPVQYIKEFIRGYEHSKLTGNLYMSSYITALGMQRLYAKIGIIVSLHKNNINNTFVAYADDSHDYIIDEKYIWYKIVDIEEEHLRNSMLYCIKTDNGFVAENMTVA